MAEEFETAQGMSRRDMLQKSAIIGGAGALAWAAPSITKYGGAAFGDSDGTLIGKGISYIAIKYTCDGGATHEYVKFDDYNKSGDGKWVCSAGNFETPGCPDLGNGQNDTGDCSLFNLSINAVDEDGEPTSVTVCFVGSAKDCYIVGDAFGKCGAPDVVASGGECLQQEANGCVTFDMCGV